MVIRLNGEGAQSSRLDGPKARPPLNILRWCVGPLETAASRWEPTALRRHQSNGRDASSRRAVRFFVRKVAEAKCWREASCWSATPRCRVFDHHLSGLCESTVFRSRAVGPGGGIPGGWRERSPRRGLGEYGAGRHVPGDEAYASARGRAQRTTARPAPSSAGSLMRAGYLIARAEGQWRHRFQRLRAAEARSAA